MARFLEVLAEIEQSDGPITDWAEADAEDAGDAGGALD